jgi:hypothetical protein
MPRFLLICVAGIAMSTVRADDLERPPIRYSKTALDNPISQLHDRLKAKIPEWEHDRDFGYLLPVLKELDIPKSSQCLVYSKTSFQRDRITPKTPRAIYFNDEVYVGFCLRGDVLEFSVADPNVGTAFFTLSQDPEERPRFIRQTDNCLACHSGTMTRNMPGHIVRSVYSDPQGQPILSAGTHRTDPTSPFEQRFGGWYVSGTHGKQSHRGNLTFPAKMDPETADLSAGQNLSDLSRQFTAGLYPTPHSDLVALMVLVHQVDVHNRMAYAALETKSALYYQEETRKALGEPEGTKYESVARRIESAASDLLDGLLFVNEYPLKEPIAGTSGFREEFEQRGPADGQGRSLRQFDLKTRLFRYPCSYLILSRTFDQLPREIKNSVVTKLDAILNGKNADPKYAHLGPKERQAIREILLAAKPNLFDGMPH